MAEPFFDGNAFALVKNGIVQDFFADFNSLENDLVSVSGSPTTFE